jgi:SAM-dependent methyltransferase
VDGLRVLECGTGEGQLSRRLIRAGARVDSVDLSGEALVLVRSWAGAPPPGLVQADLHALPFATASVDRAAGNLVLHHLDTARAAAELARVLKPGGVAVFSETFRFNPFLAFARRFLVGRFGIPRLGTLAEQPLGDPEVATLARHFDVELIWPEMLCFRILDRQVFRYRVGWVNRLCIWLDRTIFARWPSFGRWSYRGTIRLIKKAGS